MRRNYLKKMGKTAQKKRRSAASLRRVGSFYNIARRNIIPDADKTSSTPTDTPFTIKTRRTKSSKSIVHREPTFEELFGLGTKAFQAGDRKKAKEYLLKALSINPDSIHTRPAFSRLLKKIA